MAQSPKRRSVRTAKNTPKAVARSEGSKLDQVVRALRAPKGATIRDLMKITAWQAHSVRGALAGALKRKRGLTIISTKAGAERVYRIGAGK